MAPEGTGYRMSDSGYRGGNETILGDPFGKVTAVSDGDTFSMESESRRIRVRICCIDAPAHGQPGYGQAVGVPVEHD